MTKIDKNIKARIKKLNDLAVDLRDGNQFNITRLTIIKKICKNKDGFDRFSLHLSEVAHRLEQHPEHKVLIGKSLQSIQLFMSDPSEENIKLIHETFIELRDIQNEVKQIRGWPVRMINCTNLLIVEHAVECVSTTYLEHASKVAYQMARTFAERYDPGKFEGLVEKSAPLVQEMADFWIDYYDLK